MATTALSLAPTAPSGSFARTARLYVREIRFEILRTLRNRTSVFSALGFPVLFYLLFGVVNKGETMGGGHINVAKYLLGGYAVFGLVGAALFGIGFGLAMDRASGWRELKRASPMPPMADVVARCTVATLLSIVILQLLCILGITCAGVHLSVPEYLRMLLVTILGSIPFAGMGLLLATMLPVNAAAGILNMIYLPMSYCSGLWVPFALLPHWVQRLAPALPTYHLARLMQHATGYAPKGDSVGGHALALLGFTLLFVGCAAVAFGRSDSEA